jgi:hypothetical protein
MPADRGRVNAIAGNPEDDLARRRPAGPLGHVELLLHQGGESSTVTGVELIRPHSATRDTSTGWRSTHRRRSDGRLFTEQKRTSGRSSLSGSSACST